MTEHEPLTWRRLATRLGIFLAVVAALDLGIGLGLAALLPHVRTGLAIGVVNNALDARADAIVLGSSRAMRSFDDAELTRLLGVRVHNAGVDGRGALFARGLLALVCERHPPSLVILDLAWVDDERANARALAPWYGRSPIVDVILVEGDWRERLKLASQSFRMNGVALAILRNLWSEPAPWGFAPLTGRLEPSARLGDGAVRPLAHPPQYVEQNLLALVADARRCGAGIAFTESPSFGDAAPADVRALYERVAARAEVPFIRIAADELPGFGPGLFRDRGHLNAEGAAVFTRVIAARLRPVLPDGAAAPDPSP